jgi:GntR family transcriptional regulator / MocR family aminotransferase
MKSMDFAARLGAGLPPHSMCGKGLQRRMAAKDAISCGRICETDHLDWQPMRDAKQTLWQQLFELPDEPALSLQARLRTAVVREILNGRLAEGTALPSSRDLAQLIGLSRNTVTAAYRRLVDENFLVARARSGIFVAAGARQAVADEPASPASAPAAAQDGTAPDWKARVRRSLQGRPTLSKPEGWSEYPYPFVYGRLDPQLFPIEAFRECCTHALTRARLDQWASDFETDEVPELIEQIRKRVLPKRGVFALPEEIVVTVGAQQAFHLLAEALIDRHTRLGFEEPGYPHARNCFALRKPQLLRVPVDAGGAVIDGLPALDYLFVTPSQHSPTTATLSLERRHTLLAKAQAQGFVVIEDDYEAENLYDGTPIPALKSMDRSGHVIYIGSLSKSLSPALRLGYIVAPRHLAAELRLLRHAVLRHPSAFLQNAYALFLSLGHHESHARRVNQAMQQRMVLAADGLRRHLSGFGFTLPRGGASIWVRAPKGIDGGELALAARAHGVLIEPGNVFFDNPPYPCPYFRLRLSSITPAKIDDGLRALADAMQGLSLAGGAERMTR